MPKRQFPSPEFFRPPTEEELGTQRKREKLDRRYDHLLAERKKLFKELEKFDLRDYDVVFLEGTLSNKEVKQLADDWLKKVREKTELFTMLDRLGIEIFTDDLKRQPGFKDTEIIFESERVQEESIVNLKGYGGLASCYSPKIEIAMPEPGLRDQMHYFFAKGSFREAVQVLIHELIHRYHLRENSYTEGVLTEAQAYASGLLNSGTQRNPI